jgi:hypothetical protein
MGNLLLHQKIPTPTSGPPTVRITADVVFYNVVAVLMDLSSLVVQIAPLIASAGVAASRFDRA